MSTAQVTVARSMADSDDFYEMDACANTYETCRNAGCIHVILMAAAAGQAAVVEAVAA